jgi:hypothetical protein
MQALFPTLAPRTQASVTRGVQISSLSINGSPSSMNSQMLDGNNNVLSYVGEVGVPPAVDAVEEFKVQSGTMSAEFGFTAGGTINLVTKSGTNLFHGTLYEFLRNDKFDARNTFATRRLPLRYNQFGGSLGGPIIKDRTFGFLNLEEYRLSSSTPRISSVPLPQWKNGDFSNLRTATGALIPVYDPATTRANPNGQGQIRDQFPGNIVPTGRFDPITRKILDFWPAPNRTPSNAFTFSQNFEDSALTKVEWTQASFRVDHRFNNANSIFFRYTHARHQSSGNSIYTDPTVGQNREDDQINRNLVLSDTHTFSPTLINNLRIGAMRQAFDFQAINAGKDWPTKLGLPSIVPPDQFPPDRFRIWPHRRPGLRNSRILELGHSGLGDEDCWQSHLEDWLQPSNPARFESPGRGFVRRLPVCRSDHQSTERGRHWLKSGAVPAWRGEHRRYRSDSGEFLACRRHQLLRARRLEGIAAPDSKPGPALGLAAEAVREARRPH